VRRQEVELLAIGAGPANLALAVALEELAPDLCADTLIVERMDDVGWQPGMLLPWSMSQVSFLKDLVTPRNPRSRYSFLNYLSSIGRLEQFINLGTFTPYRLEISEYLRWVARSLQGVPIEFGRRCVEITPGPVVAGEVDGWLVRMSDGGEIACRSLAVGIGRDAFVPPVLAGLPREHVIHSTEFRDRLGEFDPAAAYRVVVLGGAQSAAEMLWEMHQAFPRTQCTMMMRSIGLNYYQTSKFSNELYYSSFIDRFYAAQPEAKERMLAELHLHSFSGVTTSMLDTLYRQMYLERLTGTERLRMVVMADVVSARMDDCEVVLTYTDRLTGRTAEQRCDVVLLGTGFSGAMPKLVRDLATACGVAGATVERGYRMQLPPSFTAPCYLQGVNDASHGPADSHLSVLAMRSAEIVSDLLAHRQARDLVASVPLSS